MGKWKHKAREWMGIAHEANRQLTNLRCDFEHIKAERDTLRIAAAKRALEKVTPCPKCAESTAACEGFRSVIDGLTTDAAGWKHTAEQQIAQAATLTAERNAALAELADARKEVEALKQERAKYVEEAVGLRSDLTTLRALVTAWRRPTQQAAHRAVANTLRAYVDSLTESAPAKVTHLMRFDSIACGIPFEGDVLAAGGMEHVTCPQCLQHKPNEDCPGCLKVARHPGEGYQCGIHGPRAKKAQPVSHWEWRGRVECGADGDGIVTTPNRLNVNCDACLSSMEKGTKETP